MIRGLLALPVLASAARISDTSLEAVDPLETAPRSPLLQSTGVCTLTGWKGTYFTLGLVKAGTVDVGPRRTTFDLIEDLQRVFAAAGASNLTGVHTNQEVAEIFCSPSVRPKFPNACDFWSPAALSTLCPALAVGRVAHGLGDHAARAADTLVSGAKRLIPADPLSTARPLLPTLQMKGGCTPTAWKGTYWIVGWAKAGTVEVGPFKTTFALGDDLRRAFAAHGAGNLNGTHTNQEVAEIFCSPSVRPTFPNACDFWSPTTLGTLCPALVVGNLAHGLGWAADRFKNLFRRRGN